MLFARILVRITGRRHLDGLLEHFDPVAKGAMVVETALKEYVAKGFGPGFQALCAQIDTLEGQADKIKRRVRNHLPLAAFLEVDKTLFLNCTRSQDNILDAAQDAFNWLGMRPMNLPRELLEESRTAAREACRSVELLKPALTGTLDLIYGRTKDRAGVKETIHNVRVQHHKAAKAARKLVKGAFAAQSDFRDIYQFTKFMDSLHDMTHNAEGTADVLRAMIAR